MTSTERESSDTDKITAWFKGRLPDQWRAAEVVVDREEITVVLDIPTAETSSTADDTSATDDTETLAAAAATSESVTPQDVVAEESAGRISRFRDETRAARVAVAREAERRFERKVAWGVRDGETTQLFTTLAVPVMTRLRQSDRLVLDTLVDSGVARSRAHALAWCVSLVGQHSADWLGELRQAMSEVERVRAAGPA